MVTWLLSSEVPSEVLHRLQQAVKAPIDHGFVVGDAITRFVNHLKMAGHGYTVDGFVGEEPTKNGLS